MKNITKVLCLICICAISVLAQKVEQPRKIQFVEVPRNIVLQVVAVQPACPVKIEDIRYFAGVEGGFTNSYQLHNIGTKTIRSVTVASSNGAINTYARETGILAMPGQIISPVSEEFLKCQHCTKNEVVPLTDELREKLKLKGEMRSIIVLMVVSVEFTDGTKYDDEVTYKAMQTLLDDLGEAMNQYKRRNSNRP